MKAKGCGAAAAAPERTRRPTGKPTPVAAIPAKPTKKPAAGEPPPTRRPTSAAPTGVSCPGVDGPKTAHGGHLYGYVSQTRPWDDANAHAATLKCCSRPEHLATVTSLAEKAAVEAVLQANRAVSMWTGMYSSGGAWVWIGTEGSVDTAGTLTDYLVSPVPDGLAGYAEGFSRSETTTMGGDAPPRSRSEAWSSSTARNSGSR